MQVKPMLALTRQSTADITSRQTEERGFLLKAALNSRRTWLTASHTRH